MSIRKCCVALVALSPHISHAQTPMDFQPGSLVNLGVAYPSINISPIGSLLQSLDQASTVPVLTIPTSQLAGANAQVDPSQKFMVFMIDEDVVQQSIRTTFLHWFQPDMVIASSASGGLMPPSTAGANPAFPITQAMTTDMARLVAPQQNTVSGASKAPLGATGQTNYLPPGPPPGPPHRYVQLLYAQPKGFTVPQCFQNVLSVPGNQTANSQNRLGFDINQFIAASGIRTRPVAANYFRAQNAQPGPLDTGATSQGIVNARCPGVTPAGTAMPGRMRRWMVR